MYLGECTVTALKSKMPIISIGKEPRWKNILFFLLKVELMDLTHIYSNSILHIYLPSGLEKFVWVNCINYAN